MLPEDLEQIRQDVPVVHQLGVPARSGRPNTRTQRLKTVRNIYERAGVLTHIGLGPNEGYMLTDKSNPHALYEIMAISSGQPKPGLFDHSPAFASAVGTLISVFAEHCTLAGLKPVASWSYDPDTSDRVRPSIQGEKRFQWCDYPLTAYPLTDFWATVLTCGFVASEGDGARRRRTARTGAQACP